MRTGMYLLCGSTHTHGRTIAGKCGLNPLEERFYDVGCDQGEHEATQARQGAVPPCDHKHKSQIPNTIVVYPNKLIIRFMAMIHKPYTFKPYTYNPNKLIIRIFMVYIYGLFVFVSLTIGTVDVWRVPCTPLYVPQLPPSPPGDLESRARRGIVKGRSCGGGGCGSDRRRQTG